jgi:hypothetical protein
MNRVRSVFSRRLQFLPCLESESLTSEHNAERQARCFTGWQQFVARMFQPTGLPPEATRDPRRIWPRLKANSAIPASCSVSRPPRFSAPARIGPGNSVKPLFCQTPVGCQTETAVRTGRKFRFNREPALRIAPGCPVVVWVDVTLACHKSWLLISRQSPLRSASGGHCNSIFRNGGGSCCRDAFRHIFETAQPPCWPS